MNVKIFELDKLKTELENSPEVIAAYLFGSAAKNEPVVNDIDILILLNTELPVNEAYFELTYRLSRGMNIEKLDLVFFDLNVTDPDVLYEAVNNGILLVNKSAELLTDKIEELSAYFLENEFLIKESKKLMQERLNEFCAN